MATKRHQDPKWTKNQALSLDFNYAMAEFVGETGLSDSDLAGLTPGPATLEQELAAGRQDGRLGFMDLPYQTEVLKEIRRLAKPVLEWCWDFVVLGIGGSALGARALSQALLHPQHNKLPMGRRQHKPGLWVLDNVDPDFCFGILDGLDLRRTYFNVISKSGSTAETMAQFLWVYQLLKGRLGEDTARERLIITTDPEKGPLRRLAAQEGFGSLSVPPNVGGRFSVLSAVGLLPAHVAGIDLEELLAGAAFMDRRLQETHYDLAYRLAAVYYLYAARQHAACPGIYALQHAFIRDGRLVLPALGRKSGEEIRPERPGGPRRQHPGQGPGNHRPAFAVAALYGRPRGQAHHLSGGGEI